MKILICLFLILGFALNNCNGKEEKNIANKVKKNQDSSTLVIIELKKNQIAAFDYQDKFGNNNQDIYVGIKRDTIIKKRIFISSPILYNYILNQHIPIVLFPGDTVTFKISGKSFNCISHQNNSILTNFFISLNDSNRSIFLFDNKIKNTSDEKQKISILNNLYKSSISSLLVYKEDLTNSEFIFIKSIIDCEYYKHKLIRYKVSNNIDRLKLQDTISNYIIKNKDNLFDGFISLVSTYNQSKWIQNIKTSNDILLMYDRCEQNYTGKLRDRILLDWLYNIKIKSIDKLESYTKRYISIVTDSNFKQYALENYSRKTQQLNKSDIIDFVGRNKMLNEIIKQNIGQVIYLNFWASWCIPCRQEMKDARKIVEYHKDDNNIVYLFISIDEIVSNWKEASKTELLNDLENNYLMKDFNSSKLKDKYKLNTIPRYILINKKGQIVNHNAPRPSEPRLKILLDKLLAE